MMNVLKPGPVTVPAGPCVYVVDETEGLAELYALFLKGTGYVVRAFNHRVDALLALIADNRRPDVLIMDYLGDSMPVDRFLRHCLVVHPSLRILMTSELNQRDAMSFCIRPDRFIQKPFTAEEFQQAVRAVLEYSNVVVEPPCPHGVFDVIHVWVNQPASHGTF